MDAPVRDELVRDELVRDELVRDELVREVLVQVSLRDAKAQLSRLADAAHQGATVVLTKHGRPWARLMPLEAGPAPG
ncbi:type II toxin-antitoxin system Phd/YefM family antitoxin [Synechococcus sp. 8F6]|uniref:type II toxin-antitoxin system Phd/YefM family antitoxin n=1 Tax=Synechococcus sp. 8F6 TaxID=2025606 RepID=UPI001E604D08|nr:type II toxin-antitoxin system prevent-host-death family antitoxin [Synechococcus sp. 8F6]